MKNCGIVALEKIRELKGVSAFSLVHLARDNGLDLKVFKVDVKNLPLVHRPAIFHSDNHFEYIENGHALPDLKWSGYVLTEKSTGIPVSLKEAKKIKGGFVGTTISVVVAIAKAVSVAVSAFSTWAVGAGGIGAMTAGQALASGAITGGIYGAAAGAAYGGISGTGAGKGAIQGGLLGAGLGGAGIAAKGATSLVGAAGQIGKAALTTGGGAIIGGAIGALTAPREAGALATLKRAGTGAALGGAIGGAGGAFVKGAQSAGAGASYGKQASAGFKNLFGIPSSPSSTTSIQNATTGASNLTTPVGNVSANNAINWAPGAETAAKFSAPGLASGIRTIPLPGATSAASDALNNTIAASNVNPTMTVPGGYAGPNPSLNLPQSSAQNMATGGGIIGPKIGGAGEGANFSGFLNSEVGKNLSKMGTAGAISSVASGFGPKQPTTAAIDPVSDFTTLRSFLGDTKLPAATEQELIKYVNTPLADIVKEQSFQSDKTFRKINDSYDRQAANLNRQFAQAGQNVRNSSDLRDELGRLEKDRATSLAEAEQEISNQNLVNAIQAKQFALSASLEKNQWDNTRAYELADLIGKKEALDIAIQQDNYDDFQDIVSQLLQIGFPNE